MSKIEEVRERLERLADNAEVYGLRVLAKPEYIRTLLDDHARLQAHHAAAAPIDRERPTRRRQKAVELLLAQGYHWHDGEWMLPTDSD